MSTSPIKFGTSGWRGLIADDFTFATVRLAMNAIAEHVNAKGAKDAKGANDFGITPPGSRSPRSPTFFGSLPALQAIAVLHIIATDCTS